MSQVDRPASNPLRIDDPGDSAWLERIVEAADGLRFELADGTLVERKMGAEASAIAMALGGFLGSFVRTQKLGHLFGPDCGYQVFGKNKDRRRYPDLSFVVRGRLPKEEAPRGLMRIPPDLAVEVVSPIELAKELEKKRIDLLQAGTRLVWILYPRSRTIHIYRPIGNPTLLGPSDVLGGEDVVPGFACNVSDILADVSEAG